MMLKNKKKLSCVFPIIALAIQIGFCQSSFGQQGCDVLDEGFATCGNHEKIAVRSKKDSHKKGTYFTQTECDPANSPQKAGTAKTEWCSTPTASNEQEGYRFEIKVKPFSQLILIQNCSVKVEVSPGAHPAVYSTRDDAKMVYQSGGTLTINAGATRFKVITNKLESIRTLDNSACLIRGLNCPSLQISIESNGVVNAQGKVDKVRAQVLSNGDAALQNLACNSAVVDVVSNGSAHINTRELSVAVTSNGSCYYLGNPRISDRSGDNFFKNRIKPESLCPSWHKDVDKGYW